MVVTRARPSKVASVDAAAWPVGHSAAAMRDVAHARENAVAVQRNALSAGGGTSASSSVVRPARVASNSPAFLGGLVNSSVTVSELASRVRETGDGASAAAHGGIVLATAALVIRNALLLGILAPSVLVAAALPFGSMLIACGALFVFAGKRASMPLAPEAAPLRPELPFSLWLALKYGLLFLVAADRGVPRRAVDRSVRLLRRQWPRWARLERERGRRGRGCGRQGDDFANRGRDRCFHSLPD